MTYSRLSIVQFATGPKTSMGHFLGAEKIFCLIRDIDGPAMTAASVESSQSAAHRSPWGRLGSVLYTCNRLRRIRRRFNDFWSISLSKPLGLAIFRLRFASRASRALGCRIDGVCGTGDYPLPDLARETSRARSAPEKMV